MHPEVCSSPSVPKAIILALTAKGSGGDNPPVPLFTALPRVLSSSSPSSALVSLSA